MRSRPQAPRPSVRFRTRGRTRDLRLTVKIKAKPEQIYKALTSATELCRWWLQGAETDARSVGRFRMVWPRLKRPDSDGRERFFPAHVAIGDAEGYFVDLDPGKKVAWMFKLPRKAGYPPLSSFYIEPHGPACDVTLIHAGFSAAVAKEKFLRGCAEGWEDCLCKLKLYLETGKTCKTQALTFESLRALAVAR